MSAPIDRCEFCGGRKIPHEWRGTITWHCGKDKCRVARHRKRAAPTPKKSCRVCKGPAHRVYCKNCQKGARREYEALRKREIRESLWTKRTRTFAVEGDLTPAQIEQRIQDAYRQIQRDRQEGRRLSAGDIAWQRTCDPVSSNAPDTQDLWGSRTRSPKAPRVGRAA